jgi:hypothetical protein
MSSAIKIPQDRPKAFCLVPSATGLIAGPQENRPECYRGFSYWITTSLPNAWEQTYPADEQDICKTSVFFSGGLWCSALNTRSRLTPEKVITSELGWSTVERKAASYLPGWIFDLSRARFQTQPMLSLGNAETSTDVLRRFKTLLLLKYVNAFWETTADRFAPLLKNAYSALYLPSVETTADLLARVRAHLSLNTSELARSLRIERASIYGWMKGSHTPRTEHRERLMMLANLAQTWTQLCHEPLQDLKHAFIDGSSTLIDLLSAPELNEIQIKHALAKLAERKKADAESKAAQAEKSIHEIARERGWEPVDPEIREQTIRGLSLGRGG